MKPISAEEIPFIMFGTSNVISPEHNFLRAMFTCFLNRGTFDERMRTTPLEPESKGVDHLGLEFIKAHGLDFKSEFIVWAEEDELAKYVLGNDHLRAEFEQQFDPMERGFLRHRVLTTALGTRLKQICGYGVKPLPRDIRKSFAIKAGNRMLKFITEYRDTPAGRWLPLEEGKSREGSIADWLKLALSEDHKDMWLWSKNLREIRNLYWKMASHEPLDGLVEELLQQAVVAGVLQS